MAYDEELAARIRTVLAGEEGIAERKMFGGLAFMLRGNLVCGIVKDDLMVRVGPENHELALARPHTRPMDFTGRTMRGMVYVEPVGCEQHRDLEAWISMGLEHAGSLPAKKQKRGRAFSR